MNDRIVSRQSRRYEPTADDPYWELNQALTVHLNRLGDRLQGAKVLDFGCGERPFERYFSKIGAQTVACDLQQNRFGTVDVILDGNEGTLPFDTASFDVICLFDVLEHVPDDLQVLSELRRVLRDGGLLIVSVPFMYRFHEIPHDYRRYTPTGLRYVLSKTGLEVEEIHPLGSAIFVADTLLRESQSRYSLPGARFVRRLAMRLFRGMRDPDDPCPVGPLAFLAIAHRAANPRSSEDRLASL